MTVSSDPPPPGSPQRAALATPYASLPPRSGEPAAPATPSMAPRRATPTWTDTTKARARACKTHNLARRPDGTCMACEREKREARGAKPWIWMGVALAVGLGAAWFVSQQNEASVNQATTHR